MLNSAKNPGMQCPAQHQTMSGGVPLFQVVASLKRVSTAELERRSVGMLWKRWVEGDKAEERAEERALDSLDGSRETRIRCAPREERR